MRSKYCSKYLSYNRASRCNFFFGNVIERAFYALAEKSGEHNFKQAGLFMFIGGILMMIFVGAFFYFIGLIFAILGFFSMKQKASKALSVPEIDKK